MIRGAIFDIGGVVGNGVGGYMRRDITKTLGITDKQYEETCHKLVPLFIIGKITEKEFWKRFTALIETTRSVPENLWSREFAKRRKPRKEIIRIIKELKRNGIKLASLSNVTRPHAEVNEKKGVYKPFEIKIHSFDVGLRKPDPKIYKLALTKLSLIPAETVFIDNKLENVEGARKLGIKSIFYKSPKQLKRSLINLGLLK